jgi:hypothetical protein
MMTVLQFNMEFIKAEPDPDAELFPPSYDESQSIDVKVEEKPVFVSLPPVDAGNDVSCLSAVTNHMQWQTAVGHCHVIFL